MMDWSKYYTPKFVANNIISMFPEEFNPARVIDICVGSGNFLDAALKQWDGIKAVGIDICLNDINKENKYTLHQMDALDLNLLTKRIKKNNKESKVILANPPFGKLENPEKYSIYNDKKCLIHNEAIRIKRIEALMLVSNLKLLNFGDYFGAVLPENFFTSTNLTRFRELFIGEFTDIKIGERQAYFFKSEVKTRIFIGKYTGGKKDKSNSFAFKTHSECNYQLHRGIDNSKLLLVEGKNKMEVIHFSNLKGIQKLTRYYPQVKGLERLIISKNDTLILRVGRNSGFTFKANNEYINKYISDYFYLLKEIKLTKEEHELLQKELIDKRKGIATNYLHKMDIINSLNIVLKNRKK